MIQKKDGDEEDDEEEKEEEEDEDEDEETLRTGLLRQQVSLVFSPRFSLAFPHLHGLLLKTTPHLHPFP